MTIRRLARPRLIIAKPKRPSMGEDLLESGEIIVTIKGVEKMPSAIRRSQSRSISPRFSSAMKCWSPIKGVERTKFAIRPSRSLSDLARSGMQAGRTGRLFSTMR